MKIKIKAVVFALLAQTVLISDISAGPTFSISMHNGEKWWGGANSHGSKMPFDKNTSLVIDLCKDGGANQYASLLLSDRGRAIWCDNQTTIAFDKGKITVKSASAKMEMIDAAGNLRDAFRKASATWFPPSGKTPDLLFFSAPQYNTWIELTYNQNENDILRYAQSMLDNGSPPGVLMIDDTWQAGYGDWRFEPSRFKDPKGMIDKLHEKGFKVVLWMCPWVSMDIPAFRRIAWGINPNDVRGFPTKGGFLMNKGEIAAVRWWNGYSALLDFTHPNAQAWFKEQLDGLVKDYGVDGFKFDGGELEFYSKGYTAFDKNASSGDQVMSYARFCLDYPVCEYRNAWRFQGQPVVERLHDKGHRWSELQRLVPDMIAGGLLGHPFICPDMIGGGSWTAFLPGAPFDPELFIRSAQIHALCPMMQISASPWRVLSKEHQRIFKQTVELRQKFAPRFVKLAKQSAKTGEPMMRNMEYCFPGMGYADIKDQFMMGDNLLVAPVVEKGATSRKVILPPGRWRSADGRTYIGATVIEVSASLAQLPYFEKYSMSY